MMSSPDRGVVGADRVKDFAGEVALQAADDLGHGFAFGGAPLDVGAGARAVAEPDDDGEVERPVRGRSPPRWRRCRLVLPDEAGIGATPAR